MDPKFQDYINLIKQDFPLDISGVNIHRTGDDFFVIEINSSWMFRFPRNDASQKAMEKEIKFLSKFKTTSPLAIPDYQYLGDRYGGYPKILGKPLSIELFQRLSKENQASAAQQLGYFLSAVHNFPIEDAGEIGISEDWNGNHQRSGEVFLEHVTPQLSSNARNQSTTCMETLMAEDFEGRVIHGDFYLPDHVFIHGDNHKLGVIDFGDVTIYDPAHDFQCIVEIGGEEFFEKVIDHYRGEKDPSLLKRSQLRLAARPLFVAGYIFDHKIEEQYSARIARIEAAFG